MDFSGRTILVTGASSGIGGAAARWLAAHGAEQLVLVDLKSHRAAAEQLGCEARAVQGDVGDADFWEAFAKDMPVLDHAVINAGIASSSMIADTAFKEWRRLMSTNLDGAFLSLRAAIRNTRDGGSIVLTSSASGLKAEPGTAAYGVSKRRRDATGESRRP